MIKVLTVAGSFSVLPSHIGAYKITTQGLNINYNCLLMVLDYLWLALSFKLTHIFYLCFARWFVACHLIFYISFFISWLGIFSTLLQRMVSKL